MVTEIELTLVPQKIIYRNKTNEYTVAISICEDEEITITGYMPELEVGLEYIAKGQLVFNKKYGEQFAVTSIRQELPKERKGILSFLASGIIKGVGEKKAKQIVEYFGEDTLDIILATPERLLEISGIGETIADNIYNGVLLYQEKAEIYIKLQNLGITSRLGAKIYNFYGKEAFEYIKENPYILIEDIDGIGFIKADEIASKLGISKDNLQRLQKGLLHILKIDSNNGNSYMRKSELIQNAVKLLGISKEILEEAMVELILSGDVKSYITLEEEVIYLSEIYKAEEYVARYLLNLSTSNKKQVGAELDGLIKYSENRKRIQFSNEQKDVIKNALNTGLCIVTGGPGTGKTTIINGLIDIFEYEDLSVVLAAPTGRAAKRISETTGLDALTIHRLLEYSRNDISGNMYFKRNEENPINADVIIVDEFSMIDLILMEKLLSAISNGTRLIMVGDENQLASVGVGRVLGDMIDSGHINCYKLSEIFRQAKESQIVINAHKVNQGIVPDIDNSDGKDFFFISRLDEDVVAREIIDLATKRIENYFSINDALLDIQILTPMKKGSLGSQNLNVLLQDIINPKSQDKAEVQVSGNTYREKDKVMHTKNNYEISWHNIYTMEEGHGIFNGDIGFIKMIDKSQEQVYILYDGERLAKYDYEDLEQLNLGYAMTIHKSQGSEFPVVIIPVLKVPYVLGNRNLIYTAITRGREGVVLIGDKMSLAKMVENNNSKKRNSQLAIRIKRIFETYK